MSSTADQQQAGTDKPQPTIFHSSRLWMLILLVLSIAYLIAVIFGAIDKDRRLESTEFGILVAVLIFSSGLVGRLADITIGKEGLKASFQKLEERQAQQETTIRAIQVALKGIVSRFELDKLRGLAGQNSFFCFYSPDFLAELKRLDALGFIRPLLAGGLNELKATYGREDLSPDQRPRFDLKTCMEVTPEGRAYLELCDALFLPHTNDAGEKLAQM